MHQMVRGPEGVEGTLTHLVEVQVVPLLGVFVLGSTNTLIARSHRVVDDAAEPRSSSMS